MDKVWQLGLDGSRSRILRPEASVFCLNVQGGNRCRISVGGIRVLAIKGFTLTLCYGGSLIVLHDMQAARLARTRDYTLPEGYILTKESQARLREAMIAVDPRPGVHDNFYYVLEVEIPGAFRGRPWLRKGARR